MRFNVNNYVKVRLTDEGRRIHRENWQKLHEAMPPRAQEHYSYHPPTEDIEGWSEWQMWVLMEQFGAHMHNGFRTPFETEIEIVQPK